MRCAASSQTATPRVRGRPEPELGKAIALGAWTADSSGDGEFGTGHLAKCSTVDTDAFNQFVDAYRGNGPEGTPLDLLRPGST
jgi:hypothetical protein